MVSKISETEIGRNVGLICLPECHLGVPACEPLAHSEGVLFWSQRTWGRGLEGNVEEIAK